MPARTKTVGGADGAEALRSTPTPTPTPAPAPATADNRLAQLLASQARLQAAQNTHQQERERLPSLLLQSASLAGQEKAIVARNREALDAARRVLLAVAESSRVLGESLSAEHQALLALLDDPDALEQLSGVADSLLAAPAPTPTPANSPSALRATSNLAMAAPLPRKSPAAVPEALRIGASINALIRRELEQQLEQRLAPVVRAALSRIASSGGPRR